MSSTQISAKLQNAGFYLVLGKIQKKYKRAKKVIATGQDANGPAQEKNISYPTGETPGRKEFNLADFLLVHSEVSKSTCNAFLVSNLS